LSILVRAQDVIAVAIVGLACAVSDGCAADRDAAGEPVAGDANAAAAAAREPPRPVASRLIGQPAPPEPGHAVELLDPGREPRRLLRYKAARGAHQRVHLRGSGGSDVDIGGRRVFSTHDVVAEAWFDIEVADAQADRLDCELRFERVETFDMEHFDPERSRENLRRTLDRLPGHAFQMTMDRRGSVTLPPLVLPPEMDRDTDRDLTWKILADATAAIVSLPAEPVGVGARWRALDEDRGYLPNMAADHSTDMELVAVDGDRLELSLTSSLRVAPQALSITSAGVAGLTRCQSASKARAVIDLGLVQPVEWRTEMTFETDGMWLELAEELPLRFQGRGWASLAAK